MSISLIFQQTKRSHGMGENPPFEKGYRVVLGVNKYWGLSYKKGVHIKEGIIRIKEGNRDRGLKRYYIICWQTPLFFFLFVFILVTGELNIANMVEHSLGHVVFVFMQTDRGLKRYYARKLRCLF